MTINLRKKQYVLITVKRGERSIIVWGVFLGIENLAPIHGLMTADKYVDILNENLKESKMDLVEGWMATTGE